MGDLKEDEHAKRDRQACMACPASLACSVDPSFRGRAFFFCSECRSWHKRLVGEDGIIEPTQVEVNPACPDLQGTDHHWTVSSTNKCDYCPNHSLDAYSFPKVTAT